MLLCTAFLCQTANAENGEEVTVDGIKYYIFKKYTKKACVSHYNESSLTGEIKILDSINCEGINYPVTEIWSYAFYRCNCITSVIIPNSVNEIYGCAFAGCI